MNRLSKFAWHDADGAMHLDVPAMLKELGMADTPENRDWMVKEIHKHMAEISPSTAIEDQ
jgi:hypothetical protein